MQWCRRALIATIVAAATLTPRAGLVPAATTLAQPAKHGLSDVVFRTRVSGIVKATNAKGPAKGSMPGVVVLRNGRLIYGSFADSQMLPASLLKLLTTSAAVLRFGPAYRFVTTVRGAKPDADGVVAGNLALVGAGDPTLSSSAFAARHYLYDGVSGKVHAFSSPVPTIEALAAKVAAAGVRVIAGDVVGDETLFDAARTQPGWLSSYQHGDIDVGNLSGLGVDMGLADAAGSAVSPSPALRSASLLRDALRARGVQVRGAVRLARATPGTGAIATVASPTVREIVGWVDRWSVNYGAEMLLKNLGARFGGAGTTRAGAAVVRATLAAHGVDVRTVRMADGSGLSLSDSVKPRTIAQTLQMILRLPGAAGAAMRSALPVAGRPGTLLRRMRTAPMAGNLRGKTGLLKGVRAMAGWVRTREGSTIVYVALYNKVRRPASMTSVLDFLGTSLALIG